MLKRPRPLALMVALAAFGPGGLAAQNLDGTGQQASELFPLPAGLATFEISHSGSGRFAVRLLDEQGVLVEQLAQAEGPFLGSKAVRIPHTGRYLYDVAAGGPWSIRLRNSSAAENSGSSAARDSARFAGMRAARDVGGMSWLATGLLGGTLLGPIGAGVNFALASSRRSTVPPDVLAAAEEQHRHHVDVFSDAFRARVRSNRRTAALVGGATGTLLFGFFVLQVINWDASAGGNPPGGGGEVP